MLFDMYGAGEKATERSAEICFQKDVNVSVIILPEGKDAAELVQKDSKKLIEAVEKSIPIMEYFFNNSFKKYNKDNIEEKKIIVADLLNIIRNFGNAVEKNHWIKKLAQKIEISENILIDTLKNVEKRLNRKNDSEIVREKKSLKTRADVLQEKIAGLMLNDKILWEEVSNDPLRSGYFSSSSKFSPIFEKGAENDYKFENLISGTEDREERDFLQKIYFDTRYSKTEEGVEENDLSDAREQMVNCFSELRKEFNKDKLNVLLRDIRKAEEAGDKEGKLLLIKEFNKLSKEIK